MHRDFPSRLRTQASPFLVKANGYVLRKNASNMIGRRAERTKLMIAPTAATVLDKANLK